MYLPDAANLSAKQVRTFKATGLWNTGEADAVDREHDYAEEEFEEGDVWISRILISDWALTGLLSLMTSLLNTQPGIEAEGDEDEDMMSEGAHSGIDFANTKSWIFGGLLF